MSPSNIELPHCSLLRRLAAILYDSLLLLALLFIISAIHYGLTGGGDAAAKSELAQFVLLIMVTLSSFAFFAWFWLHGGQTLGMRAWRIRLQRRGGGPITLWQAMLRYLVAIASWLPLGLGFLWSLIDKEKLTWHDRYSMTELVVIPKKEARK